MKDSREAAFKFVSNPTKKKTRKILILYLQVVLIDSFTQNATYFVLFLQTKGIQVY